MQLIGIMSSDRNAAQTLSACLWAQFGAVTMRFRDMGTRARWLESFGIVRETDHVVVSDLRDERDARFIESLGGVVLRLRD